MPNVLMRVSRDRKTLVPAFAPDVATLERLRPGALLELQIKRSPSAKMRRLYWAILGVVADNHPFYRDREVIHDVIRFGTQTVRLSLSAEGELRTIPRSTSDAAMNFEQFKDFFNVAMDFVFQELLPGVDREEVMRRVEEMLGMTVEEARRGNREGRAAEAEEADWPDLGEVE